MKIRLKSAVGLHYANSDGIDTIGTIHLAKTSDVLASKNHI